MTSLQTPKTSTRPQLRSIQALRGLAAAMVVLFHMSSNQFTLGSAGVDIFFVISGFVMGNVGLREAPQEFLIKRLVRVVPLYWTMTAVMCAGAVLGLFRNFTFNVESLTKSLLFIPYFDHQGMIWPLVVPGWTLNYEMYFYAVFALGLYVARPLAWTGGFLLLAVALGLILGPTHPVLMTWTSPLLLEFLAGLALSQMQAHFRSLALGLTLLALGVLGFAASGFLRTALGGEWRALTWGLPALMVVCGALCSELSGFWPGGFLSRPFERLGDASYSLYLTHGLIVSMGHRFLGTGVKAHIAIAVLVTGTAFVAFYGFEKPVSRWLRALLPSRSPQFKR